MASISEIESGLERLMPRGLSQESQQDIESVIDELVAEVELPFFERLAWPNLPSARSLSAIAAVGLLGLIGWGLLSPFASESQGERSFAQVAAPDSGMAPQSSGISVLESRVWLDGGEDLGIQSVNEFGDARRAWGYVGVEEKRVLHEESGYEIILQREFEGEHYASTSL